MDVRSSPKKSLMVHIGTDKTGSTALQRLLSQNKQALGRYGVAYLRTGRDKLPSHSVLHDRTISGDFSVWDELAKEVQELSEPCGLVSFEGLYHLKEDQLRRIRGQLKDIDVKILIYLRRQSDMVRSGVAQRFKQGNSPLPLDKYTSERLFAVAKNYQPILSRFSEIFGRQNLIVRRYERSRWPEQSIFLDFLRSVGIALTGDELENAFLVPARKLNPTLDVESIQLLDTLDRLGVDPAKRRNVVRILLSNLKDDHSTFVPDRLAAEVDNGLIESNRLIANEFFGESELFTEQSQFVFREAIPARVGQRFNLVREWLPLMDMHPWNGNRATVRRLEAEEKLHLGRGWASSPAGFRAIGQKSKMVFRMTASAQAGIEIRIEGKWIGEPSVLNVVVNDEVFYSGDSASFNLVLPSSVCNRQTQLIELRFVVERRELVKSVLELEAMSYRIC